ncbi:hypothetical protein [Paraburkholderia fungorum]|uniref:hypothetical protein n=1 Tax=Paraburkholderia fungorum TaxID=134537 RepID=UPI0038BAABB4
MNSVSATFDGGFAATVMLDKAAGTRKDALDVMVSGADTGYLVEWHPGAGLVRLPNSEAPTNNGIQILSSNPRFIYFNAWTGKQVRKYDRQTQRVTGFADLTFHPDNVRVRDDGKLIVIGIDELQSWEACTFAQSVSCRTGFSAVTLDPDTMATAALFTESPAFSPAGRLAFRSATRCMSDRLWVTDCSGSIFRGIASRAGRRAG